MKRRSSLVEAKHIYQIDRTIWATHGLRPLPRDKRAYALLKRDTKRYERRFEEGDTGALFEYVAIRGEKALLEDWVQAAIAGWRSMCAPSFLKGVYEERNGQRIPLVDDVHTSCPPRYPERKWFLEWGRDCLRRVGLALANVEGSGRRKEERTPDEARQAQRAASSRSKAVSRLVKKYDQWLTHLGDSERAYSQTKKDFETGRIKDAHQQKLILQALKKRISAKG